MKYIKIVVFTFFSTFVGLTQDWDNQLMMYPSPSTALNTVLYDMGSEAWMEDLQQYKKCKFQLPEGLFSEKEITLTAYPILEKEISKKYPSIIAFKGSKNHLQVYGSSGPAGLDMKVVDNTEVFHIYKSTKADLYKITALKEMNEYSGITATRYQCNTDHSAAIEQITKNKEAVSLRNSNDDDLHRYRLAIATTGEFGKAKGNTKEKVLEEVVKIINNVNSILERDLGVTLQIIDNTDTLFFFDGDTDPYTNGNTGMLLQENPSVINNLINSTSYDIGHVFGTNSGGQAWLQGVCGGQKAAGATGTFGPYSGTLFYIIVAHEFGHQLGATHAFNRCDDENESSITAFEPGSGSTIMCYAGASNCGVNYVQNVNDEYFHIASINQIRDFTRLGAGNKCAEIIPSSNKGPQATILSPKISFIPVGTPFELTGSGIDPNGDELTYCWEEYDLGPKSTLGEPSGDAPIFRSFPPVEDPIRVFPKLVDILNNRSRDTEVLPAYDRNLRFRFTVRDNNTEVGLIDWDEIAFKATSDAGPFLVQFANVNTLVIGGIHQLVQWDPANTNISPVSCRQVHILLSLDGGLTYPDTLSYATENDGSEYVAFPAIEDSGLRLKIIAADNIFFDVSNANFALTPELETTFSIGVSDNTVDLCSPGVTSIELNSIPINGFDDSIQIEVLHEAGNLQVDLVNSKFNIGEPIKIGFESANINQTTMDQITIRASSSKDTILRSLRLTRTPTDFTGFDITFPPNGSGNVGSLPVLEWKKNLDATNYEIHLSPSPAFDSLISNEITQDTFFKPIFSLSENSIFYWRVRPINDCATGQFTSVAAFQTKNINCTTYPSTDTPKTGTRKIESVITVEEDLPLVDVNLPNIAGLIQFVGNTDAKLIHSDGTTATLFKDKCANRSNFDLGFDDESQLEITCPLTDQGIHKPEEELAVFKPAGSKGNWTLQINDNGGTSGGSITSWSLQLCTDLILNPPSISLLDTLRVNLGGTMTFTAENLMLLDSDSPPEELILTLVSDVSHGVLLNEEKVLKIGDEFSFSDWISDKIAYTHTGDDLQEDSFSFIVEDPSGGWIPITNFPIKIDQTISVKEFPTGSIQVFPNPTSNFINIRTKDRLQNTRLTLWSMDGKLLFQRKFDSLQHYELSITSYPIGIHILKIENDKGVFLQKINVIP